jgi:hypothetical protein
VAILIQFNFLFIYLNIYLFIRLLGSPVTNILRKTISNDHHDDDGDDDCDDNEAIKAYKVSEGKHARVLNNGGVRSTSQNTCSTCDNP